jgi:hypothetical protein
VPGIQAPVLLIEGSIATLSAGCLHNSTLSWSGCMVALQSGVKYGDISQNIGNIVYTSATIAATAL